MPIVPLESLADPDRTSFPEVMVAPRTVGAEAGAIFASLQAPAEMLAAIVRAYAVALLKKPDARTAEGRGKVLRTLREMIDDAILDAVRDVRLPEPVREPTPPPEAPRRRRL